jgi:gamma-glutamylputrescine oxidase
MNLEAVWNAAPRPGFHGAVQGTVHADIAIVGGGLTGLSTAYHLLARQPDLRLAILEANQVGSGASGRNTGMLGPGVGQNLLGLIGSQGNVAAEALYRQTLSAVATVRDLVAKENLACDLSMGGQIHWARSVAGRRRLAAQAAWLNVRGLPAEALDDDALHEYVRLPETPGRGAGLPVALRLPLAGVLDPGKLVAGLAGAVHSQGARIFETSTVSALARDIQSDKVCLSLPGKAKVLADQVVIATAGYTSSLGRLHGRVIPMQIQALATEPIPAPLLEHIGWHRREGIIEARRIFNYFRLSADNRLIFGGGAPRPCAPGNRNIETLPQSARLRLVNGLLATFPDLARQGIRITHGWSGTIGYVINGIPVIGRSHDNPNILHAVGWSGHGIALGVAAGSWIADLIGQRKEEGDAADALALFSHYPPRVPLTRLHGLSIWAAGGAMRLLDRFT